MARAIRMDYPDTFYHVLSRGNERRDIFRDEKDYRMFLDLVGKMVDRFHLEVHAYVLMGNHYHLLVRTRQANLSQAVQWLGVSYAVWFNRRHNRSGHLFQGRFKSFLIENESYFTALCLYIQANPLRAGMVERLVDYPWSSYHGYARQECQMPWLRTDLILACYQGERARFCEAQYGYSGEKSSGEKSNSIFDNLKFGLYLGSEGFALECIQRARAEKHDEKPQLKFLMRGRQIAPLVHKILDGLGEKYHDRILRSGKSKRPNRDIAIYILSHLGVYTNKEIGETFGVGYTTITGAVRRGEKYLDADEGLMRAVHKIINDI